MRIPYSWLLGLVAVLVAGCGMSGPAPVSSASQRPEFAWARAAIELPPEVVEVAPGSSAGIQCSPCHAVQASMLLGVTATPDGLLAVGAQLPPSAAVAYRSADGRSWTPEPGFAGQEGSVAVGVAAAGGRIVVVGRRGAAAAAWVRDGGAWQAAPAEAALEAPAGGTAEMRAVVAWRDGWVAVGSLDTDASHRDAAIWTSPDGLRWRRAGSDTDFTRSAAHGITASADRLVVVGSRTGAAGGEATAGAAWTSDDGERWTRIESTAFDAGSMRAATHGGAGFTAVGFGIGDDRAAVWSSSDGVDWSLLPSSPALEALGKPIRMAAVAPAGDGLIVAGWKSDAGNGSGVVWRSSDGRTWDRVADQVSMSGGSLAGVAFAGELPVVVGVSGSPDNDQARAWYEGPETP
ncbi:MAG TPA: hypothetical protein VKB30_02705 [Candidatus Limnocylindrales bacterium]|nr:hypothetical protein [Candidatus Limnocylindrales bacterium]